MAIETIQTQDEALNQRLGVDAAFPLTANFEIVSGISCLLQDIQTLLLTLPGERVARPEFGCTLRMMIWENMDSGVAAGAASIKSALDTFEPRILVTGVTYELNRNTDLVVYRIKFNITDTDIRANLIFPFRTSGEISSQ